MQGSAELHMNPLLVVPPDEVPDRWRSHLERVDMPAGMGATPRRGVVHRPAPALLAMILAFALALAQPAQADSTARAHLPSTFGGDGRILQRVSCGTRDTLWIDHYVAGLYIPRGANIGVVRDPAGAKAVVIRMINTRYLPDSIPEKWLEALQRETPPEPLARVRRAYRQLSDGDVMTIAYRPQTGVAIGVNGRRVAQVRGHAVIDAILQAWAEEKTVAEKLQKLSIEHPC